MRDDGGGYLRCGLHHDGPAITDPDLNACAAILPLRKEAVTDHICDFKNKLVSQNSKLERSGHGLGNIVTIQLHFAAPIVSRRFVLKAQRPRGVDDHVTKIVVAQTTGIQPLNVTFQVVIQRSARFREPLADLSELHPLHADPFCMGTMLQGLQRHGGKRLCLRLQNCRHPELRKIEIS